MAKQLGGQTRQSGAKKSAPVKATGGAASRRAGAIAQLMRTDVHRVGGDASANDAARLMWEKDIGSVPVVDEGGSLMGIVTDRDIAMAAYLRGVNLRSIPVGSVMTSEVISAHADDSIHDVSALMSRRQVRRVPIVDDGRVLIGIVSLNDLALAATDAEAKGGIADHEVADAMRAISAPRPSALGGTARTRGA